MVKVKDIKAVLKNAIHKGKGKSKGFSLAEITVGLAVLGLATVALVGWQINEFRHAKARELASTLQAIDAGLYQVSSLVGYIPKPQNASWTQETSVSSDTSYGCILRNTDSWKGLVQSNTSIGNGPIPLQGGMLWFRTWRDAYNYYVNSSVNNVINFGSALYNGHNIRRSLFIVYDVRRRVTYRYLNSPLIRDYRNYSYDYRLRGLNNITNYCGTFSYMLYEHITNVVKPGMANDIEVYHYRYTPAYLYIDCASGGENPFPQHLSYFSDSSNPNNGFNPTSLIPQNLLDPRIDLRKLAEQGYRIRFNTSGDKIVSLTLFKDPAQYPEGITPEEGRALEAMIGGRYDQNSRTFTYMLNKGSGYTVQARSEIGYDGQNCWRQ